MAARHEEGCYEEHIVTQFPVCKQLSNDDVGGVEGHHTSGDTAGRWFQNRPLFRERKVGGGLPWNDTLLKPLHRAPDT